MKKIKDIFDVKYGHSYELCNMQPGDIPFVSRTEKNNGISGSVAKTAEEPTPAGVLTVALGGSVLATFLQPSPCYEGFHISTLVARGGMTPQEKLWYAIAIRANKYKYNYGRQANKELKHIRLPDPPAWVNNIEVPDYSHLKEPKTQEQVELKNWKSFRLIDLFSIENSFDAPTASVETNPGKTPLVSATQFNNGVCGKINVPAKWEKAITIGVDTATVFYQEDAFCTAEKMLVLLPKFVMSKELGVAVAQIIRAESFRFNYGRKLSKEKTRTLKISLPTKNGEPDWDGITRFIQSCKFSSTI